MGDGLTREQRAERKERERVRRTGVEEKIRDAISHGSGQLYTRGLIKVLADIVDNQAGRYK